MKNIAFIDLEIDGRGKILDIGAVKADGTEFHSSRIRSFIDFIADCDYLCGHNIVEHDYRYIKPFLKRNYFLIDTLYFSPILFPEKPYHRLIKDDKLLSDELNNPLNDSKKAKKLLEEELAVFSRFPADVQKIYSGLLGKDEHFQGFLHYAGLTPKVFSFFSRVRQDSIKDMLGGKICDNADFDDIIKNNPVELAYSIAIINTVDKHSITPPWVLKNYPEVESIVYRLRSTPCSDTSCGYCSRHLDARHALKRWFGYDSFRKFNGESLQEYAVKAAISGKSILAIFPTGGGKSLTFQLPALIAGEASKALTVVISPLQSLMKDQVENLESKGISDAVYINGLLSPVERAEVLHRVESGAASILYIAPEQLRSKTIEKILLSRTIARFVIDEAHCFSAWGQDFRIEYMNIGNFINQLQEKKGLTGPIPVSCFTATAKPKVISDITDYFYEKNKISLQKFTTSATRTNLRYTVLHKDSKRDKYITLRTLLDERKCPAIVYVSRTKLAENLACALSNDGFSAKAFHGRMEVSEKIKNQDDFINNKIQIIVATSAFGMGIDKSDVGLVVHYEISDSLENYIQEAGRAGRDVNSEADCYVLYNDDDLNKHFILLNQTKLTLSEINQVWKAVKALTKNRSKVYISALEIARKAGWEEISDVETKVRSALAALENAGFIRRGMNSPRIFATSIVPRNMDEASQAIDARNDFNEEEKQNSKRIIKSLISERSRAKAGTTEAESRIDYLSDMLGIETYKVIVAVEKMRGAGILAKDNDMTAYLRKSQMHRLESYSRLEAFLLKLISDNPLTINLKEVNENAADSGITKSSLKDIRTILFFWTIKEYIRKNQKDIDCDYFDIHCNLPVKTLKDKFSQRIDLCRFIISELNFLEGIASDENYTTVNFSLVSLLERFNRNASLYSEKAEIEDIQDALLYLAKTGIVSIEGGFMVIYNKLEIERLADNRQRYKVDDYASLDSFYKQRIQQIHIVGEYANMMVKDYDRALEFVSDYFRMEFRAFIRKYFDSSRQKEINRNVSPAKFKEIFGMLTESQSRIISDNVSKHIVVPAGPGSGKTFVLVRKLASLILMEDIKSEQLLMLTFSRAAATEFHRRLAGLIGNAAKYVEIKTFHSYCFDILGQRGSIEKSSDVVKEAVAEIRAGRVETSRITKSILVIDEAQDMGDYEFALVTELIERNDDMRVIAVGDDDQNIYAFRGSDSRHLKTLIQKYGATVYDMLDNFRSCRNIVAVANNYAESISDRLKTEPIRAVRNEDGEVGFIRHSCKHFEQAIIDDLMMCNLSGSTGVLTWTNDDALIISAMINKTGRKARLIQSNDGFRLTDMAEFRYFMLSLESSSGITVSKESWDMAKEAMKMKYPDNENLPAALKAISVFENEHQGIRYISDFENFIAESKYEDFSEVNKSEIIVSTIHKSKGCEYDNVFVSLKDMPDAYDNEKRAVYVALTRARNYLSVHYNTDVFNPQDCSHAYSYHETRQYEKPSEVLFQLSHRDVVLSFFKNKSAIIDKMQSGQGLSIQGDYLYTLYENRDIPVVKFSEAARKRISELAHKGYLPYRAAIRFIVYWRYEESHDTDISLQDREHASNAERNAEIPIILPDIIFRYTNTEENCHQP